MTVSVGGKPETYAIVATVRNEATTIREFVDSLLIQSRAPDEILIVDGDSTDGTREILETYAGQGLIRVISRPCNIAQGRNLAIAECRSSRVAITDAGCRVDRAWLEHLVRCFESSAHPDIVAGNFRFETHSRFEEAVVLGTFQPNRDQTPTAQYYPSSRSVAFTKDAWSRAGGYPEWLYAAEDTLFNIRARQVGLKFAFCQDAIVWWRPRQSVRALAKQRINFARGNARVGIGTPGYLANLRVHAMVIAALCATPISSYFLLIAALVFAVHVKRRLWQHVRAVVPPADWRMTLRVLAVMEFVRLVSMYGFLQGRWDRWKDTRFVQMQVDYMGVSSVDALDILVLPGDFRRKNLNLSPDSYDLVLVLISAATIGCAVGGAVLATDSLIASLLPIVGVSAIGTAIMLAKSIVSYSRTGPQLASEIYRQFRRYTLLALLRLGAAAFAIMTLTGGMGVYVYLLLLTCLGQTWSVSAAMVAAVAGIIVAAALQFIRFLRFNPGLIVASMPYRISRFYRLWSLATPSVVQACYTLVIATVLALLLVATVLDVRAGRVDSVWMYWLVAGFFVGCLALVGWLPERIPAPVKSEGRRAAKPNIVMIGSDTLRSDRLGCQRYRRNLTPNLDKLGAQGIQFPNCYVPCARTAPSLISLLTGTWPHTHGIRDNFVADTETLLKCDALPNLLKHHGYRSAVISDWCGADMGKFSFGFDHTDLPKDQWNLKYLIRQGPKDLRLYLSLFLHNRAGRLLLPEIYFLGGVPSTLQLGKRARELISKLARQAQPFFLNIFYSTTHPPFASEWPWYIRYAGPEYRGESKFAMAKVNDPFDIIRRQGAPREEFDLDQIIDLYDGCVSAFDDEVGKILSHLKSTGIDRDTILVVYSDHGMEFFEHGTWGQGNSAVGDSSPRIPLIIRDPNSKPRGCVDAVVRSVDLVPTLLDLVGLQPPAHVEGVSIADCITAGAPCPPLEAFNETGMWISDNPTLPEAHLRYPNLLELLDIPDVGRGTLAIRSDFQDIILRAKDRMIRSGRWKLVYQPLRTGFQIKLFDLVEDPECKRDLSPNHPELVRALLGRLRMYLPADTANTGAA